MCDVNRFLLLPDELINGILTYNQPHPLSMNIFAARMVVGLLDRASYAVFKSIAPREIHAWLEVCFVKHRQRMFSHRSWQQWYRFASLALLGDMYTRVFDDFWDVHPFVETQFFSFAMMFVESEVFLQPAAFDDMRIRDVIREYNRLPIKERRLFVYHSILVARNEMQGHFDVLRVLPYTSSVGLFIYDVMSVPQDASTHYLVKIANDKTSPKIDLRGLRHCPTEITCTQDMEETLKCAYHFMYSFYHLMKGNLYGIDWHHSYPLKPDAFIRNARNREAFKECLERCYASLFAEKDERFLTMGKSFISRYMICRDVIYGASQHNTF